MPQLLSRAINELASYTVLPSVNINFHSTLFIPNNLVFTLETQVYQDSPKIHIHTHFVHFQYISNCTGTLGKLEDRRKITIKSKFYCLCLNIKHKKLFLHKSEEKKLKTASINSINCSLLMVLFPNVLQHTMTYELEKQNKKIKEA